MYLKEEFRPGCRVKSAVRIVLADTVILRGRVSSNSNYIDEEAGLGAP